VVPWAPACDLVGIHEMAKHGRLSGVALHANDAVRFAEAVGAQEPRIEKPDPIASAIQKSLDMQGPVLMGVTADSRDNHKLMEIVHPDALN
jgi:acetolactate synthase I/II/III large subunit